MPQDEQVAELEAIFAGLGRMARRAWPRLEQPQRNELVGHLHVLCEFLYPPKPAERGPH